jgi:REP-associated tyrosine transposase
LFLRLRLRGSPSEARAFPFLQAFPIQEDEHLLTVLRYSERNALRASLVELAEDWLWSSVTMPRTGLPELHAGPVRRPKQWRKFVNEPQTELEVNRLRESIQRGRPFGEAPWMVRDGRTR